MSYGSPAAFALLAAALLPPPAAAQPAPRPAVVQPAPAPPVRFAVVAEQADEPGRMFRVYAEFVRVLRVRLARQGLRVADLVVARDWNELSRRLKADEADFVIETLFPTLALRESSGNLEPGLVIVRRGQREYRSVFFCRNESPVRSLADLRGRTVAFQVPRSTSAYALPKAALERAGLSVAPADGAPARGAVRYVFAESEVNQAAWVLHGRADAGAFNDGDWTALPENMRRDLRVFHRTESMIRGLLSFRANLPASIRGPLESALLGLASDDEGRGALTAAAGITGLEKLSDADRASIRLWSRQLPPPGPG
jgi:phosphonate transport system substrate-binding protein